MSKIEKSDPFIHLRLHSSYSLLRGAIKPEELPKLCQKNFMPAVGITDSGNLFGALEISELLVDNGVQPLIGCEFKLLQNNIEGQNLNYYSDVVLLAQNEDGYRNLLKLSSEFFLHQKSPKLALDLSQLEKYSNDLILLCGGSSGILGVNLLSNKKNEAKKTAISLKNIFGDRFYIEIQRHGHQEIIRTKEEEETEGLLLELADDNRIPIVATNNVHFKDKSSFEAQDVLLCIAQNAYLDQEAERERLTQEHYFKSSSEMRNLFSDLSEAYDNTLEVAVRCTFKPKKREPILPKFAPNEREELKRQAEEGLNNRIKTNSLSDSYEVYQKRLCYELEIIEKMGFPGYFLIVADFVQWSKKNKIPVGPGRGSGAGSLVAYCLTITDLDPIKYGLLFERFLNPERVSMPDFDIDFCQDRREEVIQYVQNKYGKDRVAQIITFGGLLSKAAIRDVGRVLQIPYPQVDKIAKLIPVEANKPVTISKALKEEPRLEEERNSSETIRRMLEYSLKIEGLLRNASTHAAGIVIGDRPLVNYVPLYQDSKSEMPATQFSMKWAEASGLVKFDFLGLKTLTIIKHTLNLLEKRDINIDIENIALDDKKTFELYSSARTMAVFQVESSGMRAALTQLKPNCLEDIIALVALYRPGPIENIPKFCRVKNKLQDREFIHPSIDNLLDETQGIIVYQEQVMEIARKMAGYSLGEADLLRRAMGKKIKKDMDAERPRFISGALKNKIDEVLANRVWLLLERFANYGFNKSHAAAYALVSYQTCWLKANYPVEFMASVMNNDINFTDKLSFYKQELNELGILLNPPSINYSIEVFSVVSDKIIYALGALKNVGIESMRNIIGSRNRDGDFQDIFDFANRVELRKIGKRSLEMLIYAGVFDEISNNRKQLFHSIDILVEYSNSCFSEKNSGQNNLFGESNNLLSYPELKLTEDWDISEKLKKEYESVGFYLSSHPLDEYSKWFKSKSIYQFSELNELLSSGPKLIKISGSVLNKQERISNKGNKFAFIQFSDPSGFFEITAFSDILEIYNNLLQPSQNLILSCQATLEENQPKLLLRKVEKISEVLHSVDDLGMRIFINDQNSVLFVKEQLEILNDESLRKSPIKIVVIDKEFDVELDLPNSYRINNDVINSINHIPGVLKVERFDNLISENS
ncbi:MAG: DNA polymerase III subunit alpha [Paracoccaceae bacterium]